MNVTKKDDHYLLENAQGSYHFSIEEYTKLGKDKAIEQATKEIYKKSKQYLDTDIDFTRARELGFCEYGINDFCEQLKLDSTKTYKLSHLKDLLTVDIILEYSNECF